MRAEEGGNQPQRVLLVGGPKHGEFMNLPEFDVAYEFTSSQTLVGHDGKSPWTSFPKNATHRYQVDTALSRLFPACNVFTHAVLWSSPVQGGFNLHALTAAYEAKDKAEAEKAEALGRAVDLKSQVSRRDDQLREARADVDDADAHVEELSAQLQTVRQALEMATLNIGMAIVATGRDYQPTTEIARSDAD